MNEKERQEKGKVTTVVEDVLMIGTGNYDSVTKKQCMTKLETLVNVNNNANKTQPELVNAEDDTINMPLEPPFVNANDGANKKQVFTIASRNVNKQTGTVVENIVYRNLYKKINSHYLLPDVIRKFETKDKGLKYNKTCLDHQIDDRRN